VQLTYPGVYVTEIPSSVRPIATVATSIAAFVDSFTAGPVDTAVQIFGMADFERIYGPVGSSPASYQIAQFFLNGGSSAWVVRVAPGGKGASVGVESTAVADSFTATAANAGTWANAVRLSVEPTVKSGDVASDTFNLNVVRYASTTSNAIVSSERYSGLSTSTVQGTVNDSSQLVTIAAASTPATPAVNGTLAFKQLVVPTALDSKTVSVTVNGGTAATVTLKLPIGATDATVTVANARAALETALRTQGATAGVPALAGATVTVVGGHLWVRTDPRTTGYNPADYIAITDGTATLGFAAGTYANVQEYVLGGAAVQAQKAGTAGTDPTGVDATAIIGDLNTKTGMYALENADLFNILCLPRAVQLSDGDLAAILGAAVPYCEVRRAMFIADLPDTATTPESVQKFVDSHPQLVSPNAAVYFPRVLLPDPADAYRINKFGNSGTVAGVWAKTDNDRGVWKAPAGIDALLRGVAGLEYVMTDGENGALNPFAIDCLRNFPVYGQVVWGARTMFGADARASEWKYVPIRRLALMIEESLFRGTKWVVFEPNDEPLWAKIRQNVGAFMTQLFRQGAFQGSTPDKAFFVKCDGETTTAADRNLGVVNIEVGFAPLKPAEFVVLKIQQIPDVT
jgi:phage tail sheath protein FI